MNKEEMLNSMGTEPTVDIWDLDEVLKMKINVEKEEDSSLCRLSNCGLEKRHIVGPMLIIVGVLYLVFGYIY